MTRPLCWLTALAVISLTSPGTAQAPPDEAARAAARTLAETGRKRFEAGDYARAIEAFRDAEKYFRAPTITVKRAASHEKLGQLLEAQAIYKQVAQEQLAPDAPSEFWNAQEEAKKSLTSLETRIPKVEIVVSHAPAGTKVTLDGKALESATLARPLRLNPGKYTVAIEPPGAARVTRGLDLKEGSTEKVELDLAPPPPKPAITSVPVSASTAAATAVPSALATSTSAAGPVPETTGGPTSGGGRSMLGPAIAFGVSGAGLLVGAITGGMGFAKVGEIRTLCGDDLVCPKGTESQVGLEGAKGVGYASTVAFALAGGAAVVGVVLLLLPGGNKGEPGRAGITLGPGFIGARGAF